MAQAVTDYALGPPAPAREDTPRARPERPPGERRPTNGSLPPLVTGPRPTAPAALPQPAGAGLRQTTGPVSLWSKMAERAADSEPSYQAVRTEGWLARGEWLMDTFSDVMLSVPGRERVSAGSVAVTNHRIVFTGAARELIEWPLDAVTADGQDPPSTSLRVGEGTALAFSEEHQARDFAAAARAAVLLRQHLG